MKSDQLVHASIVCLRIRCLPPFCPTTPSPPSKKQRSKEWFENKSVLATARFIVAISRSRGLYSDPTFSSFPALAPVEYPNTDRVLIAVISPPSWLSTKNKVIDDTGDLNAFPSNTTLCPLTTSPSDNSISKSAGASSASEKSIANWFTKTRTFFGAFPPSGPLTRKLCNLTFSPNGRVTSSCSSASVSHTFSFSLATLSKQLEKGCSGLSFITDKLFFSTMSNTS
mmetsp:Transcript_7534/g.19511  ORF Transcript_7534/g.19511 Transcript_7534/m.19511 type:complete len:226 (+) Transcript_7534:29-706(+)